ncbi:MtnX-like HAD-IB family phosphatase [bacterium]|nr:MtnX-like HAD-IB family phosphatase [bacterium]
MNSETKHAGLIPPRRQAQVWIDFDGTITEWDMIDELVERYAVDDSWRAIEAAWHAGRIGSLECLRGIFDLIRISDEDLNACLDGGRLDPGAAALFGRLAAWQVPVTILSDGVDWFISRLLARAGIRNVCVRANTIRRHGDRMELVCPYRNPECEADAAHCKCGSMQALGLPGRRSIYIGDGRSDVCGARRSDVVFAKSALAACLEKEGRPFIPFRTLEDVDEALAVAWREAGEGPAAGRN